MSDTSTIGFVRHDQIPPSPPPVTETGVFKWMRENLFSSILNAVLTILAVAFVIWAVFSAFPWMFNGVWITGSLKECRVYLGDSTGACWAVLTERWNQLLFGFTYPVDQYWRPALAFVLLFVCAAPVLFSKLPRWGLIATALYPFFAYWLIWGGAFWEPILIMIGIVLTILVFRAVLARTSDSVALFAAVLTFLAWFVFGQGLISGSIDRALSASRMESKTAELQTQIADLPVEIAALEAKSEALNEEVDAELQVAFDLHAQAGDLRKMVESGLKPAIVAMNLAVQAEIDATAQVAAAQDAVADAEDADQEAAQAALNQAIEEQAAAEQAIPATTDAAKTAVAEVQATLAAETLYDQQGAVDMLEDFANGPLSEDEIARVNLEFIDEVQAAVQAPFQADIQAPFHAVSERRGVLRGYGQRLGVINAELSTVTNLLQRAEDLPELEAQLPELKALADQMRAALPDSVAGVFDAKSLTALINRNNSENLGISEDDLAMAEATVALESRVQTIEVTIDRTHADIARIGFEPVASRDMGGFMLNMILGTICVALSIPLGIVLALGRQSNLPIVKGICVVFIEFVRGVPLITLLFVANVVLAFFLPPGSTMDLILRVIIMITVFSSAYIAEVIRGGLAALPRGQYEAGDSLGLDYSQSMRLIILPQALKISIPGIVNVAVGLFKDTTLVSVISMFDLVGMIRGPVLSATAWTGGIYWEPFLFAIVLFFIVCYGISQYSQWLERQLRTDHH